MSNWGSNFLTNFREKLAHPITIQSCPKRSQSYFQVASRKTITGLDNPYDHCVFAIPGLGNPWKWCFRDPKVWRTFVKTIASRGIHSWLNPGLFHELIGKERDLKCGTIFQHFLRNHSHPFTKSHIGICCGKCPILLQKVLEIIPSSERNHQWITYYQICNYENVNSQ